MYHVFLAFIFGFNFIHLNKSFATEVKSVDISKIKPGQNVIGFGNVADKALFMFSQYIDAKLKVEPNIASLLSKPEVFYDYLSKELEKSEPIPALAIKDGSTGSETYQISASHHTVALYANLPLKTMQPGGFQYILKEMESPEGRKKLYDKVSSRLTNLDMKKNQKIINEIKRSKTIEHKEYEFNINIQPDKHCVETPDSNPTEPILQLNGSKKNRYSQSELCAAEYLAKNGKILIWDDEKSNVSQRILELSKIHEDCLKNAKILNESEDKSGKCHFSKINLLVEKYKSLPSSFNNIQDSHLRSLSGAGLRDAKIDTNLYIDYTDFYILKLARENNCSFYRTDKNKKKIPNTDFTLNNEIDETNKEKTKAKAKAKKKIKAGFTENERKMHQLSYENFSDYVPSFIACLNSPSTDEPKKKVKDIMDKLYLKVNIAEGRDSNGSFTSASTHSTMEDEESCRSNQPTTPTSEVGRLAKEYEKFKSVMGTKTYKRPIITY